jgi:hypothetical protein
MMKRTNKRAKTAPRSAREAQHPLAIVVQDNLARCGRFDHLTVYRQGDHVFIAHRGPPDTPDDVDPVLRITHAGHWRFGLSLRRSDGRWQPVPIAGVMSEVVAEAVRTFGPWLAQREIIGDICETDY